MRAPALLLSLLFIAALFHGAHSSPPPPSSSSSFLPSLTSLLTELWDHPVAEDSVVSRVQRHVRFAVSMLVSPLQLLDFSHFAAPVRTPFTSPLAPPSWSPTEKQVADEENEGWQEPMVAAIDADGSVDAKEALRLQTDVAHALRVSVNAHKQPAAEPLVSPHAVKAAASSSPPAQEGSSPVSSASISSEEVGQVNIYCGVGQVIFFTPKNGSGSDRELCFCPYDWRGRTCYQRVQFRCPVQLVAPQSSCDAVRSRPPPTSSQSTSADEQPFSVSSSSSSFFVYEPVLSGPSPPCLSVSSATTMAVNFSCSFELPAREWWGSQSEYDNLRVNYTQRTQPRPFSYAILNVNRSGAVQWAQSYNDSNIRFSVTAMNTAHPSHFLSLLPWRALNSSHLSNAEGKPGGLMQWTVDPKAMERNLKRGGRIHLSLRLDQQSPRGLNLTSSRMPWRLYVEDSSYSLPGPTRRALLSRFQWGVLLLAIVVVVVLLLYRWYQRRQTAKFQELMAEQRGQQRSWFEASD